MRWLWRVSLRVNAATSCTTARGRSRQAPSAAGTYAPTSDTPSKPATAHPVAPDKGPLQDNHRRTSEHGRSKIMM